MKFLVFQHVPHEHPGMLLDAAQKNSVEFEIVELWKPYTIPASDGFDALVIMGGPMGVYEDRERFPSKEDELTFIRANLSTMPMIGFCLGAQLIAHVLGARIYPNLTEGKRLKEVGYSTVDLTPEGLTDPLFAGFQSPVTVLQLHGDAFDLPNGAKLLATSPICTNQAFRWGNSAYGTLFHNEYTPEMIGRQVEVDREWMHKDFEIDEKQLRKDARTNADVMRAQCERLFKNFCGIVVAV